MPQDDIRYLGDLQLLKIQPGDRFVLTVADHVSEAMAERIRESWRKFAGDDVPLLILEGDMKLGAIRTTTEDA